MTVTELEEKLETCRETLLVSAQTINALMATNDWLRAQNARLLEQVLSAGMEPVN